MQTWIFSFNHKNVKRWIPDFTLSISIKQFSPIDGNKTWSKYKFIYVSIKFNVTFIGRAKYTIKFLIMIGFCVTLFYKYQILEICNDENTHNLRFFIFNILKHMTQPPRPLRRVEKFYVCTPATKFLICY